MQIGLVGLTNSGKSTLFHLLTGVKNTAGQNKANKGVVKVPDSRVDFLSELFKPRKTTYATLEAVDIPGLVPGQEKSAVTFLQAVRDSDVLIHVIQAFESDDAPHVEGSLDVFRDVEMVGYELLLADLDQVSKRLEKINSGKRKQENEVENKLLDRIQQCLEDEKPILSLDLNEEEDMLVRNFQFLTAKPFVVVVNVDENDIQGENVVGISKLKEYCDERGIPLQVLPAKIEQEISELDGEERQMFMEDLGIELSGLEVVTRLVYEKLNLISFFTVGEDEVKAWTINRGTNARKAAGKIHSDIERGFIRAEVIEYDSFKAAGSMAAARDNGTLRLEGKEYIVKDGDIVHFRFNV